MADFSFCVRALGLSSVLPQFLTGSERERIGQLLHAVVALEIHIYIFFLNMGDPVAKYTDRLENQVRFTFKLLYYLKRNTLHVFSMCDCVYNCF